MFGPIFQKKHSFTGCFSLFITFIFDFLLLIVYAFIKKEIWAFHLYSPFSITKDNRLATLLPIES